MTIAERLFAPAKINLFLHVSGLRADGYHSLTSLVAFAGLADCVEIGDGDGFTLERRGPFADALSGATTDDGDLTLAAARAFCEWDGRGRGAHIRLTKNIPVAAGLGGGSADAAAVLVGLSRLWDRADAPLHEIGLELGADVPVAIDAVPALVSGIGEVLTTIPPLPPLGVVLVNPGMGLETRAVFAAHDEINGEKGDGDGQQPSVAAVVREIGAGVADGAALGALLGDTANDLTGAACTLAPEIRDVLLEIASSPGCLLARMSGSGATCFGLYEDIAAAEAATKALGRGDGWWVWAGTLINGRDAITV